MNLNILHKFTLSLDLLQKSCKNFRYFPPYLYFNVAVRSLLVDPFVSDSMILYFIGLLGRRPYRHIVTKRIRGFPVLKYEPKDLTLSIRSKSLNIWLLLLLNELPHLKSNLVWNQDKSYGHHIGISTLVAPFEKDPFNPYYSGYHMNWFTPIEFPWIKLDAKKKKTV